MNNFTKLKIVSTVLMIGLLAFPLPASAASSNFSPTSITLGVGQSTTINLIATGATASNAADLVVSFNAAQVQITNATAGPGLSTVGPTTLTPNFTMSVFQAGNFTSGQVLATLTIQGVAQGTSNLNSAGTTFSGDTNSPAGTAGVTITVSELPRTAESSDIIGQAALASVGVIALSAGIYLYFAKK
jgi:hypothetical protein